MEVLETIHEENLSSARLHLVLQKDTTSSLGPARLSAIQASSGVTLYIRPPSPIFVEEQMLECRDPIEAFARLFPLLFASFHFPLPYQYGTEYNHTSTDSNNAAATSRWKRQLNIEQAHHQEEKRSKKHSWGLIRDQGTRAADPGRGGGAGSQGAARN